MVKYGRAFHKGLMRLSVVDWAHIDYDFYKQALKAMANAGETVLHTDFSAEGAEAEGVRAMDAAFRRSLFSDIVEVDRCFAHQCRILRERLDAASADGNNNADAQLGCRESLLMLHRWSALNYVAVLKIVKKHDKSGLLAPLRAAAVAALRKASFVRALEWSEASHAAAATTGGESENPDSPPGSDRAGRARRRSFESLDAVSGSDEGVGPSDSSRGPISAASLAADPLITPFASLIRRLPEPCEAELQAILREVASDKYQPHGQLHAPQRSDSPPPPMSAEEATALASNFALTYCGYAALLAAKKPFTICKHALGSDLTLTPRSLGAIDTAQLVAFSVGSLGVVPLLAARTSHAHQSRPLAAALLGSAACVFFASTQSRLHTLVLAAFCNGLLSSWAYPSCVAILSRCMPAGRRARLMGLWGTTGAVGNLAGAALSYAALRHFSSWRIAFSAPAALLALVGCASLMFLRTPAATPATPEPPPRPAAQPPSVLAASSAASQPPCEPATPDQSPAASHPPPPPPSTYPRSRRLGLGAPTGGSEQGLLRVLAIPHVASLAAAYCLMKPTRSTLTFWLPYYLRTQLAMGDSSAAFCITLYDLGSLFGSLAYSVALERLTLGQLFAPLSLLLALCLFSLASVATLGTWSIALLLPILGSTLGGLELIASGSAAGAIVDEVGGSMSTVPAIVGALTGFGSLASLFAVSGVSSLLDLLGWEALYASGGMLALVSCAVLLPMASRASASAAILATTKEAVANGKKEKQQ